MVEFLIAKLISTSKHIAKLNLFLQNGLWNAREFNYYLIARPHKLNYWSWKIISSILKLPRHGPWGAGLGDFFYIVGEDFCEVGGYWSAYDGYPVNPTPGHFAITKNLLLDNSQFNRQYTVW